MLTGVIFATSLPSGINCTDLSVTTTDLTVEKGVKKTIYLKTTPPNTTDELEITTQATDVTATVINNNKIEILVSNDYEEDSTSQDYSGDLEFTLTCGNVTKTLELTLKSE